MQIIRNGDHIIIPHHGEVKKAPIGKVWMAKTSHDSLWYLRGWTEEEALAALDVMVKNEIIKNKGLN